jgi:hypothetical protein
MEARHWRLAAVAVLLAAPAFAQEALDPAIDDDEPVNVFREGPVDDDDIGVVVRGGLSSFTGALGGATDMGAFLGVHVDMRPLTWGGVEFGYEGSANSFSGGYDNGTLWRHNVGTLAKVGPELNGVRPFLGAGFGVSFLNPSNEAEGFAYTNDTITEVPLAAGIDYRAGEDILLGVRATYRLMGGEQFGPADEGNLLTAGISLGGSF